MNGSLQKHVFSTYLTLRYGIVAIGALLPLVVYVVGLLRRVALQPSISAYYWAPAGLADAPSRNWFVGFLFAVGAFLYLYKGFSQAENAALNAAAIFAVGVAIFPMEWNDAADPGGFSLHGICAVSLFVCLAYVMWFRSGDTLPLLERTHPKLVARFRRAYRVLGAVMLASPLTAVVLNATIGAHGSYVFFVESAGIWAFAAYWWTKTAELSRSQSTAKALYGQVSGAQSRFGGQLVHQSEPPAQLEG